MIEIKVTHVLEASPELLGVLRSLASTCVRDILDAQLRGPKAAPSEPAASTNDGAREMLRQYETPEPAPAATPPRAREWNMTADATVVKAVVPEPENPARAKPEAAKPEAVKPAPKKRLPPAYPPNSHVKQETWHNDARKALLHEIYEPGPDGIALPPPQVLEALRALPGLPIRDWDQVQNHASKRMGLRRNLPVGSNAAAAAAPPQTSAEALANEIAQDGVEDTTNQDADGELRMTEVALGLTEVVEPEEAPAPPSPTPWISAQPYPTKEADIEQIRYWAEQRHIYMRDERDLAAVNLKCRDIGHPEWRIRRPSWQPSNTKVGENA